jgi:hypothetical protein
MTIAKLANGNAESAPAASTPGDQSEWADSPSLFYFFFSGELVVDLGCVTENDATPVVGFSFGCFGFLGSRLLLC